MGTEQNGIVPLLALQKTVHIGAIGIYPRFLSGPVGIDLQPQSPQVCGQAFSHGLFMMGLAVDAHIIQKGLDDAFFIDHEIPPIFYNG